MKRTSVVACALAAVFAWQESPAQPSAPPEVLRKMKEERDKQNEQMRNMRLEPAKPGGAARPAPKAEPSAPASGPSRVTYGQTRKISGDSATKEEKAVKPASTAPVLQQAKPPCVYKPVMTDADMAACR